MNVMKLKDYEEVKNKLYAVVTFSGDTQERIMLYGNTSLTEASKEITKQQLRGNTCILISENPDKISSEITHFERVHRKRITATELIKIMKGENENDK